MMARQRQMAPVAEQMPVLMRGVDLGDPQLQRTMENELRERLEEDRPLRVYCGYDPSRPDLTLGHTLTMRKLRQFQDFGHEVTFLIGSFTGLIGDPSDKESLRPMLSPEEVEANARTYTEQAFKILDRDKTIVRYNHEWLAKLTFRDVIRLASHFTVSQFLARENFAKRFERGDAIYLHEFFYSLMQGYDAVALETDVQVGGSDQLFNLMVGRDLQRAFGQRPQVCLTMPILVGTDGRTRMSKSAGNYIGISEPPQTQFGKVMSLPDWVLVDYFTLVTDVPREEIETIKRQLAERSVNPMEIKKRLARLIVTDFWGEQAAREAEEEFVRVFSQREQPEEIPEYPVAMADGAASVNLPDLLTAAGVAPSKGEVRRVLAQGGVYVDGTRVQEPSVTVRNGSVIRFGRLKWLRVVAA
jgi:tyrosyl-tRNA synthetase